MGRGEAKEWGADRVKERGEETYSREETDEGREQEEFDSCGESEDARVRVRE